MESILEFIDIIQSTIKSVMPITLWNVLDIAVLAFIIYKLITLLKETRAGGLIKGLILVAVFFVIANLLQMNAVTYLIKKTAEVGLFAVVVLFQPELRRIIERLGHTGVLKLNVFNSENKSDIDAKWNVAIDVVCESCERMAGEKTGALIVFEREAKLGDQIDKGTMINAIPTTELVETIFYKGTLLHDGAVIMRDGMVYSAGCLLPPTDNKNLDQSIGTRHRAAIGMSENSDAITVVVSEEKGVISVTENGKFIRGLNRDELKKYLRDRMFANRTEKVKEDKRLMFRRKS